MKRKQSAKSSLILWFILFLAFVVLGLIYLYAPRTDAYKWITKLPESTDHRTWQSITETLEARGNIADRGVLRVDIKADLTDSTSFTLLQSGDDIATVSKDSENRLIDSAFSLQLGDKMVLSEEGSCWMRTTDESWKAVTCFADHSAYPQDADLVLEFILGGYETPSEHGLLREEDVFSIMIHKFTKQEVSDGIRSLYDEYRIDWDIAARIDDELIPIFDHVLISPVMEISESTE